MSIPTPSAVTDFWVCIPARRGSTRLPDKPLADLCGWPMVLWVASVALQSGALRVIVATDDQEIFETVSRAAEGGGLGLPPAFAGATPRLEVMLTASDHPTGTDRLAEVARQARATDDQIIVNLQGDEPLMPPQLLAGVALQLAHDPQAAVATAACPIREAQEIFSPHVVKLVCDQKGRALYFSRAPIPFCRDGWSATTGGAFFRHLGLYAYRAGPLQAYSQWAPSPLEEIEKLEQLRWLHYGQAITVRWLAEAPPAGVDTVEDLARVREVLSLRTRRSL
ncbi:MAG: 3-deoxy-manno-octulosonate cytidylyltransferase [Burkholderiaceae bacterium]